MLWDNEEWATRHITKHNVTTREAWEVVYESGGCVPLVAPDSYGIRHSEDIGQLIERSRVGY